MIYLRKNSFNLIITLLSIGYINAQNKTTADIVEDVASSVVVVASQFSSKTLDGGQGSGVIIDDGMTVITNVHVVGGPDMVSCACLTGLVRRLYNEWPNDSVVSEALDICRFAEAEAVASIVLSEDISYAG